VQGQRMLNEQLYYTLRLVNRLPLYNVNIKENDLQAIALNPSKVQPETKEGQSSMLLNSLIWLHLEARRRYQ